MENEAIADEILNVLQVLLEAAGPEWVMEFLTAGMESVQGGGEEGMPPDMMPPDMMPPDMMGPEVMSQGGPGAMPPPGPPQRGMMGRRIPS